MAVADKNTYAGTYRPAPRVQTETPDASAAMMHSSIKCHYTSPATFACTPFPSESALSRGTSAYRASVVCWVIRHTLRAIDLCVSRFTQPHFFPHAFVDFLSDFYEFSDFCKLVLLLFKLSEFCPDLRQFLHQLLFFLLPAFQYFVL